MFQFSFCCWFKGSWKIEVISKSVQYLFLPSRVCYTFPRAVYLLQARGDAFMSFMSGASTISVARSSHEADLIRLVCSWSPFLSALQRKYENFPTLEKVF